MSEENKQLVRRWFEEVWNKGSVDAIDEMFAEDGIAHGLSDDPSNPIKGPTGFKPFHTVFREAFPNMMITVEDTIAEDDKVAARCSVRARHEGEFMGRAASGRFVTATWIEIFRMESGKAVEGWVESDTKMLMDQLNP